MKTVFLHGLGQTAHDWGEVIDQASLSDYDCPELSHSMRSLDFTSELKKVSCPVAIVCGEKDASYREQLLFNWQPDSEISFPAVFSYVPWMHHVLIVQKGIINSYLPYKNLLKRHSSFLII